MNKAVTLPTGSRSPTLRVWLPWNKSDESITFGDMVLSQDFREFIESLNDNQVRYLVIGGYAVALHGHPRYTKDIDVWIERTEDNTARLVTALAQFGFASLGLTVADFREPNQVIQLGYPPNRIDILTTLAAVEFDACFQARVVVMVDETPVNFIDLENLKKNKRAAGRHQDLADLENLT